MFDFGFPELLLILIVTIFAIGPKEMPGVMRGLARIVKRLQYIRFSISRQFDDVINDVNLEDMRKDANTRAENKDDIDAEIEEDEVA